MRQLPSLETILTASLLKNDVACISKLNILSGIPYSLVVLHLYSCSKT